MLTPIFDRISEQLNFSKQDIYLSSSFILEILSIYICYSHIWDACISERKMKLKNETRKKKCESTLNSFLFFFFIDVGLL